MDRKEASQALNKSAPGKGETPSLLTVERAWPALPEHERWTHEHR